MNPQHPMVDDRYIWVEPDQMPLHQEVHTVYYSYVFVQNQLCPW